MPEDLDSILEVKPKSSEDSKEQPISKREDVSNEELSRGPREENSPQISFGKIGISLVSCGAFFLIAINTLDFAMGVRPSDATALLLLIVLAVTVIGGVLGIVGIVKNSGQREGKLAVGIVLVLIILLVLIRSAM